MKKGTLEKGRHRGSSGKSLCSAMFGYSLFFFAGASALPKSLALSGLDHFSDVGKMVLNLMPANCLRDFFRHYFFHPFFPELTSTIVILSLPKISTTIPPITRISSGDGDGRPDFQQVLPDPAGLVFSHGYAFLQYKLTLTKERFNAGFSGSRIYRRSAASHG